MVTAKDTARQLIDRLPESATLGDIPYELYVRQRIEAGMKAAQEGRVTPHAEARQRYAARAD